MLLLFVEVLDLIQIEQDAIISGKRIQFADDRLDIRNGNGRPIEFVQFFVCTFCNNAGDCGFADTGRPVKNQVWDVARFNNAAQDLAFAEDMLLSDHVVQRLRADFIGKRHLNGSFPEVY